MSTLRAYKFLIVPVVQEVDEMDVVLTEHQTQQPDAVFGVEGLRVYAENFPQMLGRLQAQMNGNARAAAGSAPAIFTGS